LELSRGIIMRDTSMTVFFQIDQRGEGEERVRPPGRLFVLDPQLFALYDVLCRTLHGQTFERRSVTLFALGRPDSVIEVTVENLGTEPIHWGERPVQARKLRISDAEMEFFLWVSPRGALLRLEQPEFGMLVERRTPVRPPKRPTPRTG
jgi:hypothetical protein